MTRRRWIADEVSDHRAALTGTHAEHLIRVLRARVGQEFDVVAGAKVRRGQVSAIADGRVEFDLGEEVQVEVSFSQLTILLAIFKFDRMEWAIEKCAELGVSRIVPVMARRTDAHLTAASAKRVQRWRRLALQASEQSRRAAPPEIPDPTKLQDTVGLPGRKIVLAESERNTLLLEAVAGATSEKEVLLAIGPEGGWDEGELELFHKSGWTAASLGSTILRAETAAIAAAAIAMAELSR